MDNESFMKVLQQQQRKLAAHDAELAKQHGTDLNPFSTPGGRAMWQAGWDGVRPALLTDESGEWRFWERGRQARLIHDENGAK